MEASQAFGGKGSTGMGFQVALELKGTFPVGESQGRFYVPGPIFGRVRTGAAVVMFQPIAQIPGKANVVARGMVVGAQDIDVEEYLGIFVHGRLRSALRSERSRVVTDSSSCCRGWRAGA